MKINFNIRLITATAIICFISVNCCVHQYRLVNNNELTNHYSALKYNYCERTFDTIIIHLKDILLKEKDLIFQASAENRIVDIYHLTQKMKAVHVNITAIKNFTSKQSFDSIQSLVAQLKDYELILKKIDFTLNQPNKDKLINANLLSNQLAQPVIERLLETIDSIKSDYERVYQLQLQKKQIADKANLRNTVIIVLIGLLLICCIIIWIIIDLHHAQKKFLTAIKNISSGNLSSQFEKYSKNDFQKTEISFNDMSNKLAANIQSFEGGAKNIFIASAEISDTAQQLSEGASEQASSSDVITVSMEQMVRSITQNSENAQDADKISQKISIDIVESNNAVSLTLQAMKDIANKISVINHIADRTDLLAINAGIEAARAGEYGKGFGYVASEIRRLAENSGKAAVEIENLITNSLDIAEKSNLKLNHLVPSIEKILKLVQEISASNLEQNSNANQINSAMVQLNRVTQQNACTSEELAATVAEFSAQAEQLLDTINLFKTEHNETLTQSKQAVSLRKKAPKTTQNIKMEKTAGVYLNLNEIADNDDKNYNLY